MIIQEVKEVYEGEVTELTPVETENPHGGYGKTISHLIIGLKTTKGSKSLKLDPTIYENIQKEKIQVRSFTFHNKMLNSFADHFSDTQRQIKESHNLHRNTQAA